MNIDSILGELNKYDNLLEGIQEIREKNFSNVTIEGDLRQLKENGILILINHPSPLDILLFDILFNVNQKTIALTKYQNSEKYPEIFKLQKSLTSLFYTYPDKLKEVLKFIEQKYNILMAPAVKLDCHLSKEDIPIAIENSEKIFSRIYLKKIIPIKITYLNEKNVKLHIFDYVENCEKAIELVYSK